MKRTSLCAVLAWSVLGCASKVSVPKPTVEPVSFSPRPTVEADLEAPPEAEIQPVAATIEEEPNELPTTCASSKDGICTPPAEFAKRLCKNATPDVALSMFRKGTPWTRAYIRRDMEAWYVAGGRSSPKQVHFGEEVIIVANRNQGSDGMGMTGSYDVYRWDGTCVSVMADEVATRAPGMPEYAIVPWKRLDEHIQEALERNKKIAFRNEKRREACSRDGDPEMCESAIEDLSRIVVDYVRTGGEVPAPRRIP